MGDNQSFKFMKSVSCIKSIISVASFFFLDYSAGTKLDKFFRCNAEMSLNYTLPIGSIRCSILNNNPEIIDETFNVISFKFGSVCQNNFGKSIAFPLIRLNSNSVLGTIGDFIFNYIVECEHRSVPAWSFKQNRYTYNHAAENINHYIDNRSTNNFVSVPFRNKINICDSGIYLVNGTRTESD